ncbi:hypothetical protein JHK87_031844 [Glycine soja]|nr:hypothetical protein JHK87_031844 [Glycine soja]
MIKNLEQVVAMVLTSFPDQHPHVRWADINAIGQLSTDLGPDLQAHAASTVLNFSENCTSYILTLYLDGIVSKLLVLLQEHFQKYYDAVMSYLKAILVNATDKFNRMLHAASIECISLDGMVVGKEKFRADANQVMEVLMSLQVSQMETDDPTTIGYGLDSANVWDKIFFLTWSYRQKVKDIVQGALFPEAGIDNRVGHAGGNMLNAKSHMEKSDCEGMLNVSHALSTRLLSYSLRAAIALSVKVA